jgi:hypothetical protein
MGRYESLLIRAAITVVAVTICLPALAQAEQAPGPGRSITFRADGHQVDRLAPTPPYAQLAVGLYGRQILQTPSPDSDYTVQVWSLLVSPKTTTGEARLPGAAVLILLTGRVEIATGVQRVALVPGATAAVAENGVLRIANVGEQPVQMRAVIVTGTR